MRRTDISMGRIKAVTIGLSAAVVAVAAIPLSSLVALADEPIGIAEVKHDGPVSFEREVLPILRKSCLACHGSSKAEGELVLENPETILRGGSEGPAAVAGKGAESLLLKVASLRGESPMPPDDNNVGAKRLTPEELGLIKVWIDQGAAGSVTGEANALDWRPIPPGVNPIYAVAISEDGQFAAAGRGNQILLYHVPSHRELGPLIDPSLASSGLAFPGGAADLDEIQSLAFSPDGERLISGGFRTAKVWRRQRNGRIAELPGPAPGATAIAVSPDGSSVAIGETSGRVQIWAMADRTLATTLIGHTATISGIAWATDGERLATASQDGTLRLWNRDATAIASITAPSPLNDVVLVDGKHVAITAGADHQILVWDFDTVARGTADATTPAAPARALIGHSQPVTSLARIDDDQILSGSLDGTLRVWQVSTGGLILEIPHGGPVVDVAVRGDGQRFASASLDAKNVKVWNRADGKPLHELRGEFRLRFQEVSLAREAGLAQRLIDLASTDLQAAKDRMKAEEENLRKATDERQKAIDELAKAEEAIKNSVDQKVVDAKQAAQRAVENANRAAERAAQSVTKAAEAIPPLEKAVEARRSAHQQAEVRANEAKQVAQDRQPGFLSVVFASDQATLLSTCDDQILRVWDSESGSHVDRIEGTGGNVRAIACLPNGAAVTASENGTIAAWQTQPAWILERTIGDPAKTDVFVDRVTAVDVSPDGAWLATGTGEPSRSGVIAIWNLESGELVRQIPEAHTDQIFALDFSRDGTRLASGSADRFIRTFDVATGDFVRAFEGHTHHVLGVAWSADGRQLASGGGDKVIKVWNVATGEPQRTIQGFTKEVTCVRYVGDSDQIVASSGDASVALKNAATGGDVRSLAGASDFLYAVGASADGAIIVAGGRDGVLRVWQTDGTLFTAFGVPPRLADE